VGSRFDAILFDAGGVLVVPDPTVLGPLLAPYGGSLDHGVHHRAHYRAMRVHDTAESDSDWLEYDRAYVRGVGVSDPDGEALHAFHDTFNPHLWRYPNPGAVDVLRELVARGVPIGVVSNAHGLIGAVLERAGVCQVGDGDGAAVSCVIDSHLVGVAKPDPRIFHIALEHLGIEPERVAYVGDSARYDVRGAEAAGLVPVQLDPYDDAASEEHERVRSLTELLALV
jgi:putative hydrolase of the HAD superfamily